MQANIDVLTAMNVADLQKSFKVDQRPVPGAAFGA